MKEGLEKCNREQLILLRDNKQNIIDFLLNNNNSVSVEDLKVYEILYKCYREKGKCHICNSVSNIICMRCRNYNKEVWLMYKSLAKTCKRESSPKMDKINYTNQYYQ